MASEKVPKVRSIGNRTAVFSGHAASARLQRELRQRGMLQLSLEAVEQPFAMGG